MRRALVVTAILGVMSPRPARADEETFPTSRLLGPTFGLSWGGGHELHGIVGLEGGLGFNALVYANAGVTYRADELFAYAELDGWYVVGATAGFGYGTRLGAQAVVGIWEPWPVETGGPCSDRSLIVLSVGYRWTGLHELYLAAKGGDTKVACMHD